MSLSPQVWVAIIGLLGLFCQWLAWRVKLPAILFLLSAGLFLGPMTGWLNPDHVFGEVLLPMVSLAVAVILFEGSLTLNMADLKALKKVVRLLVTVGVLITWLVVSLCCGLLLKLDWSISILFGAITVVTGPTVIVPMLRAIRPTAGVAQVLRWEGIVIDPIGALLTVVVFEFLVTQVGGHALSHSLILFFKILIIGLGIGVAAGHLIGVLLRDHWIPEYLQSMATLCLVLGVFTLSNSLAHESGLLVVTVAGMWLANMPGVKVHEILNFKEHLTILLISGLFIVLAARLDAQSLLALGWLPLVLLAVVQLVARPLAVLSSTIGSELNWQEKALLAWIAPRGIVAAAVAALFALRLEQQGFPNADLLVPLTFVVILGTVILQSATAGTLATLLKVREPEPKGLLIIGANTVAIEMGTVLKELGFRVMLTDSSWENIRTARMAGLETFYGNPVSEYADQKLDLVGIGKLLALSPQHELNAIASIRYRMEFGEQNIYSILSSREANLKEKHQIASEHKGFVAFGDDLTYGKFSSLLSQGAEIRKTKLTEEFNYEQYLNKQSKEVIPLFAVTNKNSLRIFTPSDELKPTAGWTIVGLTTEIKIAKVDNSQ